MLVFRSAKSKVSKRVKKGRKVGKNEVRKGSNKSLISLRLGSLSKNHFCFQQTNTVPLRVYVTMGQK